MSIVDLDVCGFDRTAVSLGGSAFDEEMDDDSVAVHGLGSTARFNPNSFGMDGSVMVNYDVHQFADNQNALTEMTQDANPPAYRTLNDGDDGEVIIQRRDIDDVLVKEEIADVSFRSLQRLHPVCKEVEIPKNSSMHSSDKQSPLLLVSKNQDYQVFAYNVETKKLESDTRASLVDREHKVDSLNDRKVNPANYAPIHHTDYEFSLLKRATLHSKEIVVTRSDNTRTICPFSDDYCFNTQNPIGYLLKTAMFNFRKINDRLDSQRNIQYHVDRRLRDALNVIEGVAADKLVFRREYHLHYDEAISIIGKFVNNEFDIHRDTIMYAMGSLLRVHPAIVSHNDEEHNRPYIVSIVFDTIVDIESFLPNSHTGKNVTTKTFVIPWLAKAFHIGDFNTSLTWDEIFSSMDEGIRKSMMEFPASVFNGISIVKDGNPKVYYYKVGKEVRSIWSVQDKGRAEGIYRYDVSKEELKKNPHTPFYKEPVFMALEDADKNGFYSSRRECELDGDVESHSKVTSAFAALEAAKTSLLSHQENQSALRTRTQYVQKEEAARQKALELKIAELEKKAEVEKVRDYYEQRSHDRKDTTEVIKFMPTVIGGVLGILTAAGVISIIGRKEKYGLLDGVLGFLSGQMKGYLAILGGAYAIVSLTSRFVRFMRKKKVLANVWEGIKDIGMTIYDGTKSVASSVYNAGKAVVISVRNVVSDTFSNVGNFISDCFSFG